MVNWKAVLPDEARKTWDENLMRFDDYTYPQTYSWGEFKGCFGWQPCRWAACTDNGTMVSMVQGLLRKYPGGVGVLWIPGGPVGDISTWNQDLRNCIMESIAVRRLYCRFNSTRSYSASAALALRSQAWNRAEYPMLSGLSMIYNPAQDEPSRLKACTGNWRHNLRRSSKYELSIHLWSNPDPGIMASIYGAMQEYKDLEEQFSSRELSKIFELMQDKIVLYRCDDKDGEPVAFRGCTIIGNKAWDLFAATNVKGRNLYASYGLFWKLIEHCNHENISFFEMSGIDPVSNQGVYNFKKGTGAQEIEYLGEWEWATSDLLRWGFNLAIRRRSGRL